MSKSENELKTALVKDLQKAGWFARRLEDQYGVGLFDMLVGIPFGPTVAIEAKRVEHQSFGPTLRQKIELDRFVNNSDEVVDAAYVQFRMSWLLGFKEGLMYLYTAADTAKLSDCVAQLPGEPAAQFFTRFWNECLKIEK